MSLPSRTTLPSVKPQVIATFLLLTSVGYYAHSHRKELLARPPALRDGPVLNNIQEESDIETVRASEDTSALTAAAVRLAEREDKLALVKAEEWVHRPEAAYRIAAAQIAMHFRGTAALFSVLSADSDPKVRGAVVSAIHNRTEPELAQIVDRLSVDEALEPRARYEAMYSALKRKGFGASSSGLAALISWVERSPDPAVQAMAIRQLSISMKRDRAVARFVGQMAGKDRPISVRIEALRALGMTCPVNRSAILTEIFSSEKDFDLVQAALRASLFFHDEAVTRAISRSQSRWTGARRPLFEETLSRARISVGRDVCAGVQ